MFSIQEQCYWTHLSVYLRIFYHFLRYKYIYYNSLTEGYPVHLFENLHILS